MSYHWFSSEHPPVNSSDDFLGQAGLASLHLTCLHLSPETGIGVLCDDVVASKAQFSLFSETLQLLSTKVYGPFNNAYLRQMMPVVMV
jgi:hypothetical protein